ncbi:efflux transporter, RND family, MFP subunit [Solidesulfovibrio fructosivorans JJ]]|uniref:Efflux transporter, RND family, MFP subunit n=1 Tax=Solidesulfovibrio fructosivorans JJ] TaxID=596151 RepID=E1JSX6_SOLFR|nr:efflux RND transporter periplasmic adaptor subunit [Solidesulfovibrio fructosivorans]EFL52609.1 efflux transporter, RND family, MFP subunit [Solidesulfovibrio fructosivorans JJ]]
MLTHHKRIVPALVALVAVAAALFALSGCKGGNEYVPPPPPKVKVAPPERRKVTEYMRFTGNTQAVNSVDLRARIEGFLVKQAYVDGATVKKGQLLFVIQPEPYEAKVLEAKAGLQSQLAGLHQAEIEYVRAKNLLREKAGPDTDVVKWDAQREQYKAGVENAKAQIELAQINLSYTKVTAPFNGRVSRRDVDVGNLVGGGEKTLLATIISYDPMYVYFTLGERDLLRLQASRGGKAAPGKHVKIPVEVGFSGSTDYPYKGVLDYYGLGIDPKTGTILLRGELPNPDGAIAPGLFARVRIPLEKREALLVPDTAVGQDQLGRFVLILNDKNVVEQRPVTIGFSVNDMLVVDKGLKGDERVIVSDLQRVRAGGKAEPMPDASASAPAASAGTKTPPAGAKK